MPLGVGDALGPGQEHAAWVKRANAIGLRSAKAEIGEQARYVKPPVRRGRQIQRGDRLVRRGLSQALVEGLAGLRRLPPRPGIDLEFIGVEVKPEG